MKHISEKKRFSMIARAHSFKYAARGLGIIFKTQHNFWLQTIAMVVVIFLGFLYDISLFEWMAVILCIMSVLITEAINTAFEIDIDLTSPEYHPYAKDTKDVAAGAVLLASIASLAIGLIIFAPKVFG